MSNLYPRALAALAAVSRHEFVAGADLASTITGHSIPSRKPSGISSLCSRKSVKTNG